MIGLLVRYFCGSDVARRELGELGGREQKIILHLISALVGRVVAGRGGTTSQD